MNTMKKEDMEKERDNLITQAGLQTISSLKPLSDLLAIVGRALFLQSQINLATAKPAPKTEEPVKLEMVEAKSV